MVSWCGSLEVAPRAGLGGREQQRLCAAAAAAGRSRLAPARLPDRPELGRERVPRQSRAGARRDRAQGTRPAGSRGLAIPDQGRNAGPSRCRGRREASGMRQPHVRGVRGAASRGRAALAPFNVLPQPAGSKPHLLLNRAALVDAGLVLGCSGVEEALGGSHGEIEVQAAAARRARGGGREAKKAEERQRTNKHGRRGRAGQERAPAAANAQAEQAAAVQLPRPAFQHSLEPPRPSAAAALGALVL